MKDIWLEGLRSWLKTIGQEAQDVYVVAYVAAPPFGDGTTKGPASTAAYPVKSIGVLPDGIQFGSDLMFHAFAAIPVHWEEHHEIPAIVDYLTWLISYRGVFGKIVITPNFPYGDVILRDGHWFPVQREPLSLAGILFLNAYVKSRRYGGAEEGGWWYDEGFPLASIPILESDMAAHAGSRMKVPGVLDWFPSDEGSPGYHSFSARGYLDRWVYGEEAVVVEEQFAAPYPQERPTYS